MVDVPSAPDVLEEDGFIIGGLGRSQEGHRPAEGLLRRVAENALGT